MPPAAPPPAAAPRAPVRTDSDIARELQALEVAVAAEPLAPLMMRSDSDVARELQHQEMTMATERAALPLTCRDSDITLTKRVEKAS